MRKLITILTTLALCSCSEYEIIDRTEIVVIDAGFLATGDMVRVVLILERNKKGDERAYLVSINRKQKVQLEWAKNEFRKKAKPKTEQ